MPNSINSEKWNPEQMGIIGLGNSGQCPSLMAIGAGDIDKCLGFFFARSSSEEKYHFFAMLLWFKGKVFLPE